MANMRTRVALTLRTVRTRGGLSPAWTRLNRLTVSEENDLSLNLYLGHTDAHLFLGFEVTDEFLDLDVGQDPFRNDSVGVISQSRLGDR